MSLHAPEKNKGKQQRYFNWHIITNNIDESRMLVMRTLKSLGFLGVVWAGEVGGVWCAGLEKNSLYIIRAFFGCVQYMPNQY